MREFAKDKLTKDEAEYFDLELMMEGYDYNTTGEITQEGQQDLNIIPAECLLVDVSM